MPLIYLIAGEQSGDEIGARLMRALLRQRPDLTFAGIGSTAMTAQGLTSLFPMGDLAVMGLLEVLPRLRLLRGRLRQTAADIAARRPDAVVTIDSPGFTLRVLRAIAPLGIPRVHFVAPQVWAWRENRVRHYPGLWERLLCLLPFEPAWFAQRGVMARFIGHPLFSHSLDEEALGWEAVSYGGGRPKLALLPGSRTGEIAANWPLLLNVCDSMQARYERLEAVVAASDEACAARIRAITPTLPRHIKLVVGQTDAVLHWCDLALPVSGTVTLHVARHRKPMAIVYRVNAATWHGVGRWVIDTRTFTLPNLIACNGPERTADHHVVKEFVPWLARVDAVNPIVAELSSLIEDPQKRSSQLAALSKIVAAFDGHDAGKEAAAAIGEMFEKATAHTS